MHANRLKLEAWFGLIQYLHQWLSYFNGKEQFLSRIFRENQRKECTRRIASNVIWRDGMFMLPVWRLRTLVFAGELRKYCVEDKYCICRVTNNRFDLSTLLNLIKNSGILVQPQIKRI